MCVFFVNDFDKKNLLVFWNFQIRTSKYNEIENNNTP